MFLCSQIGEFADMPDLDDAVAVIVFEHVQQKADQASQMLQVFFDCVSDFLSSVSSLRSEELVQRPFVVEAIKALVTVRDKVQPVDGFEGKAFLSAKDAADFATRLEGILEEVDRVKLLWIADALRQVTN
jgi:hypothetical protein